MPVPLSKSPRSVKAVQMETEELWISETGEF